RGVLDDSATLPDAQQPGERREVDRKVDGQIDHVGSALTAEQVDQHDAGDEGDREAGQSEQAEEEVFERDDIHSITLAARRRREGCASANAQSAATSAARPNTAETSAITTSEPVTLPATRTMKPCARPYAS